MSLVEVKFDTSELEAELQRRFGDRVKNLPMDAFAQLVVNAVDEMFETEGAAGTDGSWSPLSLATLKRRPNRAGGMLLQDTGATANIQVFEIDEFSITIGSPTRYAKFHVDGTKYMDRRDFFALNYSLMLEDLGDLALQQLQ